MQISKLSYIDYKIKNKNILERMSISDIFFMIFYGAILVFVIYLMLAIFRRPVVKKEIIPVVYEQPVTEVIYPWYGGYNWWPYWYPYWGGGGSYGWNYGTRPWRYGGYGGYGGYRGHRGGVRDGVHHFGGGAGHFGGRVGGAGGRVGGAGGMHH